MKKLMLMVAIMTSLFLLNSCTSANKPDKAALDFMNAIKVMDFDKARSYCTEKGTQSVDFISLLIGTDAEDKEEFLDEYTNVSYIASSIEILEEETKAVVTVVDQNDDSESTTIKLIKVKGKWMVDGIDLK